MDHGALNARIITAQNYHQGPPLCWVCVCVCVCVWVYAQPLSHVPLFGTPRTVCSLPGSSVHGILQPGKLEWVSISFSRGSSQPRNRTQVSCVSCIDRCIPYPAAAAAKSLQSCPTLCDPIEGSPLGSSVPGILQARILEWVAISFSNA